MTNYQADDWELDLNFGVNSINRFHGNVFQKKGIYFNEPDKELTLAFERYKYPQQHMYLEDDDTNSSVTSGSVVSSQFSELDTALNDLDEFMFDEPPSSRRSTLFWTPVTVNDDLESLPGVVKKVTAPLNHQEIQDNDDWTDDIDIPTKGIASIKATQKCYDQQLTALDELQGFEELDIANNCSTKTSEKKTDIDNSPVSQPRNFFSYEPERDDEDGDMTGIDFPDNMAILPKRLDEKKKYPHQSNTTQQPSKSKPTTRIPVSSAMKSKSKFLLSAEREDDDDDFCDGLNIKEKAFAISSPPPICKSSSIKTFSLSSNSRFHQRQQPRIKGKEPNNFVSKLARPSPLLSSSSKQSEHALSLAKRTNIPQSTFNNKQKSSIFTSQITPSSRFTNNRVESSTLKPTVRNTQYLTMNKSLVGKSNTNLSSFSAELQPVEKRSATGYTLIARPKTKVTSYCSRLDNIDNLNDLRPKTFDKKSGYTQNIQLKHDAGKSNFDRPWCKNIQKNSILPDRSKVKLIQPNQQNLKKKYNDMTYDDSNHCWRGNETSLVGFQDKPAFKRPMLIMNKQQKNAPSRYAAVVGSSMIFNAESQKWVSANGQGGECNELDSIEDLKDELLNSSSIKENSSHLYLDVNQVENRSKDFKLTILSKRRMMAEQEQHESWIANWPIRAKGF